MTELILAMLALGATTDVRTQDASSVATSGFASGSVDRAADFGDRNDTAITGDENRISSTGGARNDVRENLITSAYLGTAVDNFAGSEVRTYLNPEAAGPTEHRLIFGFDFEYRLVGDRYRRTSPKNSQLWIYGETLRGVRSRDVECPTDGQAAAVCADIRNTNLFPTLDNIPEKAGFIMKNATSFEGYVGLRWEFLGLNYAEDNEPKDTAASVYLRAQAGLLAIAPNEDMGATTTSWRGSDSVDNHLIAIGVVATNGGMSGSYVEVGFGRTDLFDRNDKRWKFDGLLSFKVAQDWVRPFVQVVVDSDFGNGSDSIQTFVGIDFDVGRLAAF